MKIFLSFFLTLIAFFASNHLIYAVCPVCTVAVGAGLSISRLIGIDDTITGIWIGGLIISSGLWIADWLGKKNWKIPQKETISVSLFFLFVILPLYWAKIIGLPGNTLWGIDKILLGTVIGLIVFLIGVLIDKWLRKTNNNKVYIYYQKVIIPVLLLSIVSFIFYLIIS